MATILENLELEIAHFDHFKAHLPGYEQLCPLTLEKLLRLGVLQVSTAFEQVLARLGGHELVSMDCGDLYRKSDKAPYSDAKLSCVRTYGYGKCYAAPVTNIFNKTGALRVQVYERKQGNFYYFVIPRKAYMHIPRTSNIEISFLLDGTPRRIPSRKVNVNFWKY
mgnify:FL=1